MRDNVCYAGFAVRFFAWLVDMAVMLVPLTILHALRLTLALSNPAGFLSRAVFFRYSLLDIALYLLPTAYFIAMTWSYGATLGKMLLKLEVVSAERERLTLWQMVLREVFGRYLSVTLLFIGYLMMVPDREKRALHDRIADTRVIYAHNRQAAPGKRPANAKPSTPVEPPATPAPVTLSKPLEASAPVEKPLPIEETAPPDETPVEDVLPVEEAASVELSKPAEPSGEGETPV